MLRSKRLRMTVLAVITALVITGAPAVASGLQSNPSGTDTGSKFASRLEAKPAPVVKIEKQLDPDAEEAAAYTAAKTSMTKAKPKKAAPLPVVKKAAPKAAPSSGGARKSATTSAKAAPASGGGGSTTTPVANTATAKDKTAEARAILARYISMYPILAGTTVQFGDARGHQAIALYQSGRIIISPNHRASLDRIIAHEIWHIIDWRDNGQINWGENVPPKNAADFRR